jgi:hypothetical protein
MCGCGGGGGGGIRSRYAINSPAYVPKPRMISNPTAVKAAKAKLASVSPFANTTNMSKERRVIEQKRRTAILRALGK